MIDEFSIPGRGGGFKSKSVRFLRMELFDEVLIYLHMLKSLLLSLLTDTVSGVSLFLRIKLRGNFCY